MLIKVSPTTAIESDIVTRVWYDTHTESVYVELRGDDSYSRTMIPDATVDEVLEALNLTNRKKTGTDPMCEFCLDYDILVLASKKMPQSVDKGKTVTYVNTCSEHAKDWWDSANWNGRHLEKEIT